MGKLQVTCVSSKGQVVIPGSIRSSLGITSGTRLVVLTDGENVLMKPLEAPKLAVFESLIAQSRAVARRAGMKASDVGGAIRRVRDADRARR